MFVPSDLHGVPNHLVVFLAHLRKHCMRHQHCCELEAPHWVQAQALQVGQSVHPLEGLGSGAGERLDWRPRLDCLDTHREDGGLKSSAVG